MTDIQRFVGRRQCAVNVMVTARMRFIAKNNESAGIAAVQAMNHQLHVERALEDGKQVLKAVVTTAEYDRPPYFPGFARADQQTDHCICTMGAGRNCPSDRNEGRRFCYPIW